MRVCLTGQNEADLHTVCVYLYVVLCDLDLCGVDVVHQQAESPAVHLLYPHSFGPALRHLACEHGVEVRAPGSQNHPVSSDLHILRHDGHITQQALTVDIREEQEVTTTKQMW